MFYSIGRLRKSDYWHAFWCFYDRYRLFVICEGGNTGTNLQAHWHKQRLFLYLLFSVHMSHGLLNVTLNLFFLEREREERTDSC